MARLIKKSWTDSSADTLTAVSTTQSHIVHHNLAKFFQSNIVETKEKGTKVVKSDKYQIVAWIPISYHNSRNTNHQQAAGVHTITRKVILTLKESHPKPVLFIYFVTQ